MRVVNMTRNNGDRIIENEHGVYYYNQYGRLISFWDRYTKEVIY